MGAPMTRQAKKVVSGAGPTRCMGSYHMLSMQPHRLGILAIVDVMSGTPTGKTIVVGGGYGEDRLAPMPWGG
jgi:hypothetical protein